MANIAVRNVPSTLGTFFENREPLRWMENLLRWDPFGEMAPVVKPPQALFDPDFEVKETKEAYEFRADVPGLKEKDVEVTVIGNRLMIRGTREAEKIEDTDRFYACERTYGAFTRSFTLPDGADVEHVHGELKEGVLTVIIPKGMEAKARKITLEVPKSKA